MGRWRNPSTSEAKYQRRRASYLKRRETVLARARDYYKKHRPAMLAALEKMRDVARTERLRQKSKEFRKDKPGYPQYMARLQRSRDYVNGLKSRPCKDCHHTFPPYVMDYDHVHGTKRADVSTLVSVGTSRAILGREIAKCDLVCSNCHRIRTFTRQDKNLLKFSDENPAI